MQWIQVWLSILFALQMWLCSRTQILEIRMWFTVSLFCLHKQNWFMKVQSCLIRWSMARIFSLIFSQTKKLTLYNTLGSQISLLERSRLKLRTKSCRRIKVFCWKRFFCHFPGLEPVDEVHLWHWLRGISNLGCFFGSYLP